MEGGVGAIVGTGVAEEAVFFAGFGGEILWVFQQNQGSQRGVMAAELARCLWRIIFDFFEFFDAAEILKLFFGDRSSTV